MSITQIDNVSAGYVFAYDANTGDVLWTHEKFVEVLGELKEPLPQITEDECEQVKAEAAKVFRGRKVEAMIAPEGFALSDKVRISVDVDQKTLCEIPDKPQSLTDRFADSNQ